MSGWMAPLSQLLHDLERGVPMDRQGPETAESGWTSDYSRVAASGCLALVQLVNLLQAEGRLRVLS